MTADELRRRGTLICQRLNAAVDRIAPEGLGHWPRTWEIVDAADAEFMLSLVSWEVEPTPEAAADIKAAYSAVLDAWRQATDEYDQERPTEDGPTVEGRLPSSETPRDGANTT